MCPYIRKEQIEDTKDFIEEGWESVKTGAEKIIVPFSEWGKTFAEFTQAVTEQMKKFKMPELAPKIDIALPEITMPQITMPQITMPSLEIPETLPLALGGVAIAALLIMGL